MAAHELRSPVGVLSGTADMLGAHWDELEPEERSELLRGMKPSADRLRRLLTDLLTTSRIQAGALNLDLRPIDVREQLETAAATARRTPGDGRGRGRRGAGSDGAGRRPGGWRRWWTTWSATRSATAPRRS